MQGLVSRLAFSQFLQVFRGFEIMTIKTVGLIGAGLMGFGIAKNVLKKGFALNVVAHKSRDNVESLVKLGAKELKSAAEVATQSDLVILCVTGTPQVEEAIYGAEGVLKGA